MKTKIIAMMVGMTFLAGCIEEGPRSAKVSDSGVQKIRVTVPTDKDGLTVEQKNVAERLLQDNKVGAVKHLYVQSAYSGQVLIYSTVRGKVTSSGKRLTPKTVAAGINGGQAGPTYYGMGVNIGGSSYRTTEVLQDDGTYGDSMEYLYWWDTNGRYHQHYINGGQIVHISDYPLAIKDVVINLSHVEESK